VSRGRTPTWPPPRPPTSTAEREDYDVPRLGRRRTLGGKTVRGLGGYTSVHHPTHARDASQLLGRVGSASGADRRVPAAALPTRDGRPRAAKRRSDQAGHGRAYPGASPARPRPRRTRLSPSWPTLLDLYDAACASPARFTRDIRGLRRRRRPCRAARVQACTTGCSAMPPAARPRADHLLVLGAVARFADLLEYEPRADEAVGGRGTHAPRRTPTAWDGCLRRRGGERLERRSTTRRDSTSAGAACPTGARALSRRRTAIPTPSPRSRRANRRHRAPGFEQCLLVPSRGSATGELRDRVPAQRSDRAAGALRCRCLRRPASRRVAHVAHVGAYRTPCATPPDGPARTPGDRAATASRLAIADVSTGDYHGTTHGFLRGGCSSAASSRATGRRAPRLHTRTRATLSTGRRRTSTSAVPYGAAAVRNGRTTAPGARVVRAALSNRFGAAGAVLRLPYGAVALRLDLSITAPRTSRTGASSCSR